MLWMEKKGNWFKYIWEIFLTYAKRPQKEISKGEGWSLSSQGYLLENQ